MKKLLLTLAIMFTVSIFMNNENAHAIMKKQDTIYDQQEVKAKPISNKYKPNYKLQLLTKKSDDQIRKERVQKVRDNYVTTDIEIEFTGKTKYGYYFYDHTAEFEPIIFVDYEFIEYYKMGDLKKGDIVNGVFDETGWELFALEKIIK